jgi:NAD(P)-dependent dehydrogenase (short-subunit alcohol dehydrogenase family)
VSSQFGEIDVLVNNAGISVGGAAFEAPDTTWHEVRLPGTADRADRTLLYAPHVRCAEVM